MKTTIAHIISCALVSLLSTTALAEIQNYKYVVDPAVSEQLLQQHRVDLSMRYLLLADARTRPHHFMVVVIANKANASQLLKQTIDSELCGGLHMSTKDDFLVTYASWREEGGEVVVVGYVVDERYGTCVAE